MAPTATGRRKALMVPDRRQLLLMAGDYGISDMVLKVPFTMSGGVGGAWTDESNFRTLLGRKAPVVAEATSPLCALADQVFTPWESVTWAAINSATIAASAVPGQFGSSAMSVVCGASATGGAQLAQAVTVGQPYTQQAQIMAGNPGAVGKTVRLNLDGTTADYTLTSSWQAVKASDASASATPELAQIYFTNGAEGDELLISAFQIANKSYMTPFTAGARTLGGCRIANPIALGSSFTIWLYLNTCWAGNDSTGHMLLQIANAITGANRIDILKYSDNMLYVQIYDSAGNPLRCQQAVNATNWAANADHWVEFKRDAAGVMDAYLDGVQFSTLNTGGGTGLMSSKPTYAYWGTRVDGTYPVNGPFLGAIYNNFTSPSEDARIRVSGSWIPRYRSIE